MQKTIMLAILSAALFARGEILIKGGEKIAFLGDSITQFGNENEGGYVNLVMRGLELCGVQAEKIPAGVSGNKSNQMLARLQRDVLDKKPDWVVLSCGVNDVGHGRNGVELAPYKTNITAIVDQCQKAGVKVVESSFTAGYGPDLDRTVHTRTLAFFKSPTCGLPPFFVVMDQLKAPDAKPRNYEVMWHLTNSKLTLDRQSFSAYFWDGVSLAAVFSDPEGKFVNRQGQKEPYFQGWLPIWKPGPHEQHAVPTPVAEGTFSGARRLVTVFCPYTNGVNPIASVEASVDVADRSFVLTTAEGRRCELTIPNLNK